MGTQTIALHGEFDIANVGEIENAIAEATAAGARDIVVDLREVEFLDGRSMQVLVDGWKAAARRDRRFVLVDPPARIWRVMVLLGVSRTFETSSSR